MKIEVELTKSEVMLLRIISTSHEMDDDTENDNNRAYQQTKKTMFEKIKKAIDESQK